MKIIKTDKAPLPIGSYSQAVVHADTVFVSGQIAINPETNELMTDNIEIETKTVLNNLKAVLEASGSSLDKVIKCSVFLSDMELFASVNEVYSQFFVNHKPAREAIAVKALPKYVNVEISAIAAV
ncbi:MAG: RidA family protein [Chitinophagaceae bacterium]|nr:MAG: RidA family protein [Chitinophagaceae bacterium]